MAEESHQEAIRRSNSKSRPTTPLRPSSRSSFRESASGHDASFPLNAFEPAFAELADSMADLEANLMHFQLMHESLARFSESFSSFLYGLNMNAFCVDFPEAPTQESFQRASHDDSSGDTKQQEKSAFEVDDPTFMTTDTSFIDNPVSQKAHKFATPDAKAPQAKDPTIRTGTTRGASSNPRGRGRASGLVRPRVRGIR